MSKTLICVAHPIHTHADKIHVARESAEELVGEVMTMSRESDRKRCSARGVNAEFREVRIEGRFASAKTNAKGPVAVQFGEPGNYMFEI